MLTHQHRLCKASPGHMPVIQKLLQKSHQVCLRVRLQRSQLHSGAVCLHRYWYLQLQLKLPQAFYDDFIAYITFCLAVQPVIC